MALATCSGRLCRILHRIFRCVSSNFPLRATSLVVDRAIHSVKHARPRKVACRAADSRLPFFDDELGSCLQAGETNSARPGYYLWGACQGIAVTRRGEDRGQGHGSDPFWKRNPLASRGGRPRETADSGAACIPAKKTPGKRRREDRGVSRGLYEAWLGAEAGSEDWEEKASSEQAVSLV